MANYGYNPGVLDVVKGPYLVAGAPDRTLPTTLVLNRGDIVVEKNGMWALPTGEGGELAYGVVTPSDAVGAFAGTIANAEGVGNEAGLGTVPKPDVITPLNPGVIGNSSDSMTSESNSAPLGTVRSGSNIAAGTYIVTAVPLSVGGSEFRISQFADATSGTGGFRGTVSAGDEVDVAVASVGGVSVGVMKKVTAGTGRWVVTEGVSPYYLNNLTTKSYGGTITRQGGIVKVIKITPKGPAVYGS